ncbi:unnamed protein product [Lactuca saligna]|uniref:Importin subunit alpha n=1 Tax=Lactuca saligna TaxID=75948 RepID=A0AA35Y974_LACSI|nr:unnamed protein product [Lactuca saligna]
MTALDADIVLRRRSYYQMTDFHKNSRLVSMAKRRKELSVRDHGIERSNIVKQDLVSMAAKVNSTDRDLQLGGTVLIRKRLMLGRQETAKVIQLGLVPRIVELLSREDSAELQVEAVGCLSIIASGVVYKWTKDVLDSRAVPALVKLLLSPKDKVQEQAVHALGNIAGDCAESRDHVSANGALTPLLRLLLEKDAKDPILRTASWTLSNLCGGYPFPPFEQTKAALPVIVDLIKTKGKDKDVLTDLCWSLFYISEATAEGHKAVLAAKVSQRLLELLSPQLPAEVANAALCCVCKIYLTNDQTEGFINLDFLSKLANLLPVKNMKEQVCRTITTSIITSRNKHAIIEDVIKAQLLKRLIKEVENAPFRVKRVAGQAVANVILCSSPEQIRRFVDKDCVNAMDIILELNDLGSVHLALQGINKILKAGLEEQLDVEVSSSYAASFAEAPALEKIRYLSSLHVGEVSDTAQQIVDMYM